MRYNRVYPHGCHHVRYVISCPTTRIDCLNDWRAVTVFAECVSSGPHTVRRVTKEYNHRDKCSNRDNNCRNCHISHTWVRCHECDMIVHSVGIDDDTILPDTCDTSRYPFFLFIHQSSTPLRTVVIFIWVDFSFRNWPVQKS